MAYIGYIYRFRNAKNGKSYIGKTNNPKMRINSHRTHTPISSSTKSKIAQARKIKIMQFTKDGVFVRDWDCAKDAQRTIGVDARHIGSCCRGNRKTAGGFVWKYKEGGEYVS